jgi:ATP-dependent DNA helicase RecQ
MPAAVASPPDLQQTLHDVFGFSEFRALQEDAVRVALDGRDVLVVMPTGAGKSLCFQLPAAMTPGVTVVVSPLVALMRDQIEGLKTRTAFHHLGCAYINSLQAPDEQRLLLDQLREGQLRLVYIAPERFRSPAFIEALRSAQIARFVVDEAHCISEWGHDFRPDYLSLKSITEQLGNPPLMAVTATATRRVQQSIIENLGMREPATFIGGFNRPNLHFAVHRCKSDTDRQERLVRALPKLTAMGGSGLIYVATRKQCEAVAALAARALAPLGRKAAPYHAGMDSSTRNLLQNGWLNGDVQVLVATNAFGMGIDKPDVRFVVHYTYPDSIESYYQEAGRAGRDGRKSRCVILYHFADRRTREWFIENDTMTPDDVRTAHERICAQAKVNPAGPAGGDMARIPRSWWSQVLGWNEVKTRLALAELERTGTVYRAGETGEETILRIAQRHFPPTALHRINADLERQRDERYRRLDEMVAYCKTALCRRRTTLSYFGDSERPETNGFCCDNCDKLAQAPTAAPVITSSSRRDRVPMPLRVDGSDIHVLLQALDALWPRVGKARLNKLLRASTSKDVQRFKDEKCPLYGALKGCSESQVDDFLSRLIEEGLLHQADEGEYFVCSVTAAGLEAWQAKSPLDITVPGLSHESDAEWSRDESALFETLRRWRRAQAIDENLPPYCILSDRALLEIARQKPQSETTLRGITGIGNAKLEKYGAAILDITRGEMQPSTVTKATPSEYPVRRVSADNGAETTAPGQLAGAVAALSGTIADTYVLLQEGHDIEEIAVQRGLQSATIWSHIEKIIEADMFDEVALDQLITPPLRERIESALASDAGLKPVWEQLGGEIDYGPIRCIVAYRGKLATLS